MKEKYISLLAVGIASLALLLVTGELLWATRSPHHASTFTHAFDAYSAERLMVSAAAISRMDLVEPTLPKLVRPEAVAGKALPADRSGVDFAIFGDRPAESRIAVAPARRRSPRVPTPHSYRVAMTYLSGDHKYAVIDKKLYAEDARLPSGERVAEVTDGAVRLVSAGGERWLSVQ